MLGELIKACFHFMRCSLQVTELCSAFLHFFKFFIKFQIYVYWFYMLSKKNKSSAKSSTMTTVYKKKSLGK